MIDISDSTYEAIMARDWKNAGWLFSEEMKAIHDGTPIPDNATNLDIAKQIYGKEVAIDLYNDLTMGRNWWNSPYKRGETDEG